MGVADKLIQRLEEQAETLSEKRQLDETRRARICELERKLGDAEREWDKLAAEIETLRQQLADAQRELSEQGLPHSVELLLLETADLREQLNAAQAALTRERLDAEERGEKLDRLREDHARLGRLVEARGHELETQHKDLTYARAEIETLRQERDNWKRVRQCAIEAGELMRVEIDTLRQQLAAAQREASEEFAERQVLQHEASDGYVELEGLRAFAKVMRGLLTDEYADQRIIAEALAELDAGTIQPAPVAEPLDAEGGA